MPVGTTIVAVSGVVILAGGFWLGRATAPDVGVEAIEAQTESIKALSEGNQALVSEVQEVAKAEAEREAQVSADLTKLPAPCIPSVGGNPLSLQCSWALCVRTGETDKQRCEASKLTDAMLKQYALDERAALLDAREQAVSAREAQGCPEPTQ